MKKVFVLITLVLIVFNSCKKTETTSEEITAKPPKEAEILEPAGNQCYGLITDKNKIELSFNVNSHQEVNGKLRYSLYGKDKNEGTIIGNMVGDTLIADYTFNSEGVTSVREVAFLQKDGTFIEGYGDTVESNDKVTFKDRKALKFDLKNAMVKMDCTE